MLFNTIIKGYWCTKTIYLMYDKCIAPSLLSTLQRKDSCRKKTGQYNRLKTIRHAPGDHKSSGKKSTTPQITVLT